MKRTPSLRVRRHKYICKCSCRWTQIPPSKMRKHNVDAKVRIHPTSQRLIQLQNDIHAYDMITDGRTTPPPQADLSDNIEATSPSTLVSVLIQASPPGVSAQLGA